jgi:hypothetical protein
MLRSAYRDKKVVGVFEFFVRAHYQISIKIS